MFLQPAKEVERTWKKLWVGSVLLWLGVFLVIGPGGLSLAYGSFLLWSVAAGAVWGRKAPFLTVVFFLVASQILIASSPIPARGDSQDYGLWVALVFTSCLCSTLSWSRRLQESAAALREKEQAAVLLPIARLSSVGRMAGSVGHDMKNQIAVIIGYLEQLQHEREISATHQRKIEKSLQAADKMIGLLNHMRILSKDHWNNPAESIALNHAILDGIQFLERSLTFHSITVDMQLAEQLPPIHGDAVLLQTLFIQLLQQSIDGRCRKISISTVQESAESVRFYYQDDLNDATPRSEVDRFVMQHLLAKIGGRWQTNGRAVSLQLSVYSAGGLGLHAG